jgi:hypothetical protein
MRIALAVIALTATAGAEPAKLTLTHEPPPRHLTMRPRAAAVTPKAAPSRPSPIPAPPDPGADAASIRDVHQRVQVRINLGYQVDGAALTGNANLAQKTVQDFQTIRSYGFGEGYLSTHGVGVESLSSYFAGRFQITNPRATTNGLDTPPPIATWFERSGVTTRNSWIEVKDFLSSATLAPLRVRAGQLYVYGPWVMHMYGAVAAWEGKLVRATVYGGSRVPDYTIAFDQKNRAGIGGVSAHVDFRDLPNPIPLLISGEALAFTAAGASKPSQHTQLEIDWRPRRDLALIGEARSIDNQLANEHVQFRSRYKQVTNLVFDLTHRHGTDWRWDPSVIGPDSLNDPMAPRRYLELGPVLPQLLVSARAGTLIAENFDILVRGAVAADLTSSRALKNSFSSSYLELAGALEVRLRREIALGVSALTRQTERHDLVVQQIPDVPNVADPLPLSGAIGERGFVELGTSARLSLGARKFSATLEIYGRRTRYALDYCIDTKCGSSVDTGVKDTDTRGGGRVQIDAWIGRNVRLFVSYDLSSRLELAPEITGYKSLRLMMEGVY